MPSLKSVIKTAYRKGYRVNARGQVIGPKGKRKLRLKTSNRKHAGYLYFTVSVGHNLHRQVVSVQVHRLAAYQRFGDAVFKRGVEVLHRGRSALDNRPSMLALGTREDNERDKPKHVRTRAAKRAWRTKKANGC